MPYLVLLVSLALYFRNILIELLESYKGRPYFLLLVSELVSYFWNIILTDQVTRGDPHSIISELVSELVSEFSLSSFQRY